MENSLGTFSTFSTKEKIGGGLLAAIFVGIILDSNLKQRQVKKITLENSKKIDSIILNQKRTSFEIGDTLREVKEQSRVVFRNSECVRTNSEEFEKKKKEYQDDLEFLLKKLNTALNYYDLATYAKDLEDNKEIETQTN